MPDDTLADDVESSLRVASDLLRSGRPDERRKQSAILNLKDVERRLEHDIEERKTLYAETIDNFEQKDIDAKWAELNSNPRFVRIHSEQRARQLTFENLRQVNGGQYPTNISPVLYSIPLILIGVAEWYVNYATFATMFVPFFAIAATIIVGAIFAGASHFHGEYLKQLSEIMHPSVEYRNMLGRKIVVLIATILLIIAFAIVVGLRYVIIAD